MATMRRETKTIALGSEPEESVQKRVTQRKRPDSGRFCLQVDRQTKQSYTTYEAAEAAGMAIKKAYPVLQVAVYDGVDNVSKILVLELWGRVRRYTYFAEESLSIRPYLKTVAIDKGRDPIWSNQDIAVVDVTDDNAGSMHYCESTGNIRSDIYQKLPMGVGKLAEPRLWCVQLVYWVTRWRYPSHHEPSEVAISTQCAGWPCRDL